ncbi:MAG: TetR/AcrR family transcriptional regulator [Carnobacterium sp.]|uniref:TetR/AcrR family transcriptional regulator n=1 Tax=Carnobacterium sp. TaxID=48221 RepID=UPI003315A741
MPQKEVVDIRILRSKKAISETFITLLNERDFKTISITEIVNKAGVNRGTFYKHYAYKEDILKEIQDHFLEHLTIMLEDNYQGICYSNLKTTPLSDALFIFISEHRNFFHLAIHSVGFLNFQLYFSAVLKQFLIENFFPTAQYSLKSQNLLGAYVANGIYGYLVEWDETKYASSTIEMAQQLTDIFVLDRSVFKLPVSDLVIEND